MPILTLFGAPPAFPMHLDPAIHPIKEAVAAALEIELQDVTVAIPRMANSMPDLAIKVEGIFAKWERTPRRLRDLWNKIIDIIEAYNQDRDGDRIWRKIEVLSYQPILVEQVVFRKYPPKK